MVSSQYGTDSFMSVWYLHGTDSGNFKKIFVTIIVCLSLNGASNSFAIFDKHNIISSRKWHCAAN